MICSTNIAGSISEFTVSHAHWVPKLLVARHGASVARVVSRGFKSAPATKHIVIALGGNALLRRGEEMSMKNQKFNIRDGVDSLKGIVDRYNVTFVHGNGPQSGLLLLESAAYEKSTGLPQISLDVIDAETEGMIGYLIEQELAPHIPPGKGMATILSQIVVDKNDPAFMNPTKFVGPVYSKVEADKLGLTVKPDGDHYRRVVPSPLPIKMVDCEMRALKLLKDAECVVICGGGGGIPVVQDEITGALEGVEAVIDKDRAAAMIGVELKADGLLILTDVPAVATDYKKPGEKWIRAVSPSMLESLMDQFPSGSMGPKVASAIDFVRRSGAWAAIGSLTAAEEILAGKNGTLITSHSDGKDYIDFYDEDPESFANAA